MTLLPKNKKQTFLCTPIAVGLPIIFGGYGVFTLYAASQYWICNNDVPLAIELALFGMYGVIQAIFLIFPAFRRVEIKENIITFKGLLPNSQFELEYQKCNVGMDYHMQGGQTIWWIYLCYGPLPQYKTKNKANRMNAVKIRPGFIKIMYSGEVYRALMEVLPKKQKTALETARRYIGE